MFPSASKPGWLALVGTPGHLLPPHPGVPLVMHRGPERWVATVRIHSLVLSTEPDGRPWPLTVKIMEGAGEMPHWTDGARGKEREKGGKRNPREERGGTGSVQGERRGGGSSYRALAITKQCLRGPKSECLRAGCVGHWQSARTRPWALPTAQH